MTRLLATALVALSSLPAFAWSPDVPVCEIAVDLGQEVIRLAGYDPGPGCPAIAFTLPPASSGVPSQAGAYLPGTDEIKLATDVDLTTILGQSIPLHEMVHAAQFRAGVTGACPEALETEAYRVQADFLRENGLTREAALAQILGQITGACNDGEYD